MIRALLSASGLSGIAAIGLLWAASLGVSNVYTGIKAYNFGANSEIVKCEKRVSALKKQVDDANDAVKKVTEQWIAAYDRINSEREKVVREAEQQETDLQNKVEAYAEVLRADTGNTCKPLTAGDIERLRQ